MFEDDYLLRLIKEMVRTVFKNCFFILISKRRILYLLFLSQRMQKKRYIR